MLGKRAFILFSGVGRGEGGGGVGGLGGGDEKFCNSLLGKKKKPICYSIEKYKKYLFCKVAI